MFVTSFRRLLWFLVTAFAFASLATLAQAQPPTYLPWEYGRTYRITQGNNYGGHHPPYNQYAWDFAMPTGTAVLASAPGTIREAGWTDRGWGNTVLICYGDATCSRYAHLSSVSVRTGQGVAQAQMIGRVGSTGNSSGPHLHYQVERASRRDVSIPSRFAEAGVPGSWQRVTSRNRPATQVPTFSGLKVYSSNTLAVTAGGTVTAVVVGRYRGPWSIPCGYARLGVRGDAPARFADLRDGYWPASHWASPNRVMSDGCIGNLDPGESARWAVQFHVPPDVPDGTYLTGVFAPVHEGRKWSNHRIPISLRVTGAYRATRVGQTYHRDSMAPATSTEVSVTYRNDGKATWYPDGPYPVNLRAIKPQDRRSVFLDPDDPRTVGGGQGVRIPHAVAPGETVTFTLPIKIGDGIKPGEYREYFRPVAEHRTWFGTEGLYWPFTVSE